MFTLVASTIKLLGLNLEDITSGGIVNERIMSKVVLSN